MCPRQGFWFIPERRTTSRERQRIQPEGSCFPERRTPNMKGLITIDRNAFHDFLQTKIMILDGAFGTELQKRGMPSGVCPEQWVIDHPAVIVNLQQAYIAAGSNAIYTGTFGANRLKLSEFGLGDQVVPINRQIVTLAREAAGVDGWVAGDLSATGSFIKPLGVLPFETAVNTYKEQVQGLLEGGVDFFVIETMLDLQEARAALLAVKESCALPVCVSLTFNEEQRTLTGSGPLEALLTLQSMGADAVGCNCSTGPETMLQIIAAMKPYAKVPLLAKPNAGLPKLVNGRTEFDMQAAEFASYAKPLVAAGVNLIGGCCGTTPEYLQQVVAAVAGLAPVPVNAQPYTAVTAIRQTVFLGSEHPVAIVGERINPTGKKQLQTELLEGKHTLVRHLAQEQIDRGAALLDVNVGMPGIDERETMVELVELLASTVNIPLSIDSSTPEVIEAALRIYPGRALVNSISAEKAKLKKLLPIVAKYGAVFIALPLNDNGIPENAAERFTIIKQIYETAAQYGYTKADLVVDGLVMTVSANQEAARETLKVIDWCTNEFGVNTILGLSNVSFGLPERALINSAFLTMAIGKGLTMAIANPANELLINLKYASEVLVAKDRNSRHFLTRFSKGNLLTHKKSDQPVIRNVPMQISEAVVNGDQERIVGLIKEGMTAGLTAPELVDQCLVPAINRVGELFEKKQYYLPQLIQSAETMKQAFIYLNPFLAEQALKSGAKNKAKVVLATVKGDIHDIGKNLIALMFKNQGFAVYDLGKDVSAVTIINKAKEIQADLIGLSALMTTTMVGMKDVIDLAKKEGLTARVMIGGAVVNQTFAQEIGADGYAEDAYRAVKLAQQLLEL
jgi:5-methyltetrahydrofolate--homocysteine methyltransferase